MKGESYTNVIKAIKQQRYSPIYWLEGEETFFIDEIATALESGVLKEEERDFNQVVLYGKEVDFKQVIDQCRQFPMMAPFRVVVLREAQDMRDIANLASYFKNPSKQTILVVEYKYKQIRKRSDLGKAINENALYFHAKKLYDNQVPAWIANQAKLKKIKIRPEATLLLPELLGSDLSKIDKELDKLAIVVGKDTEITIEKVNEYTGDSKEFNAFELNNALGEKNVTKAFRIVNYFAANPKNVFPPAVIGSLTNYFARVWITQQNSNRSDKEIASLLNFNSAFFIRDYKKAASNYPKNKLYQVFSLLEEYDLKMKGVDNRSFEKNDLFKELVFKILH